MARNDVAAHVGRKLVARIPACSVRPAWLCAAALLVAATAAVPAREARAAAPSAAVSALLDSAAAFRPAFRCTLEVREERHFEAASGRSFEHLVESGWILERESGGRLHRTWLWARSDGHALRQNAFFLSFTQPLDSTDEVMLAIPTGRARAAEVGSEDNASGLDETGGRNKSGEPGPSPEHLTVPDLISPEALQFELSRCDQLDLVSDRADTVEGVPARALRLRCRDVAEETRDVWLDVAAAGGRPLRYRRSGAGDISSIKDLDLVLRFQSAPAVAGVPASREVRARVKTGHSTLKLHLLAVFRGIELSAPGD